MNKKIEDRIVRLSSCHSTNDMAASFLKEGAPSGAVIVCDEQMSGRGQRGNHWVSAPKSNLTCSFLFRDLTISVRDQFLLTIVTSLAIVDTLKSFDIEAKIKWPNDIFVGNRKICGILIENQIQARQIKSTIIGIGLNINQHEFNGLNATSMSIELKRVLDLQEVLMGLIESFDRIYSFIHLDKHSDLRNRYSEGLLYKNIWRKFGSKKEGVFEGKIKSVLDDGRLEVELAGHRLVTFDFKEIDFLVSSEQIN